MTFFSDFGVRTVQIDNTLYEVEDLTKRVSNFPTDWYNTTFVEDFYIHPGTRPDQLAHQLYNDVDLWWTFYILNGISHFQWPIDEDTLEDEILDKYNKYQLEAKKEKLRGRFERNFIDSSGNAVNHQNALSIFEDSISDGSFSDISLKSLRERMIEENQNRRNIKVVSGRFLRNFINDFKTRISSNV